MVEHLTISYGPIVALDDVSIKLEAGELVAMLGSNGAGKTSLLRAISGLVRPTSGRIILDGEDITQGAPDAIARRGVAHVPEGRRIFPGLTVEQNLLMGTVSRGNRYGIEEDFARVYELFPILEERSAQDGWSLSGGQQQMLAMGRAMMGRPRLMMLDEPSLGLAPTLVRQVLNAVRSICDAGTTTLLVEQNARAALKVADRAFVLQTGMIVHAGEAESLLGDETMRRTYLGA